jgi:phage terminase large subunit-like protein
MPTREEMIFRILHDSRDLLFFYRAMLANDDWKKSPAFHTEIAQILTKGKENFAVECFRDSGKTSIVLRAFPCHSLVFPEDDKVFMVLIRQNATMAEDALRGISRDYVNHPIMNLNLVKIVRSTQNSLEVECRALDNKIKQITIMAFGKGAALRGLQDSHGRRPNIVIMDDVQSFEESRSEEQQEKDWNWFLSDIKPLGKDTRFFIIGNNLGQRCLIERIFSNNEALGFKTLRIPIGDLDKKIATWPERFPWEWIERDMESHRTIGKLDVWYRERMCQSWDEESRCFKQSQFRYWESLPKMKRIVTACDPAISKKLSADFTGITVAGLDVKNRIYIMETVKKRMNPDEIIDKLFFLQKKWGGAVGIENVAYQRMLILEMRKQMLLKNAWFTLIEIPSRGEKEARIRATLQPRFASNLGGTDSIFHHRSMADLETELITFPSGLNDDLTDSCSMAVSVLSPNVKSDEKLSYNWGQSSVSEIDELFEGAKSPDPIRPVYGKPLASGQAGW